MIERVRTLQSLERPESAMNRALESLFGTIEVDDDWPKDEPLVELIVKHGELNSWRFKIGDIDNFPSILHAHYCTNDNVRLDAHHGYTFSKMKPLGRVARKVIIDLWNDDEFRKFAAQHIDFYLIQVPGHRWRVANPRRLPLKR